MKLQRSVPANKNVSHGVKLFGSISRARILALLISNPHQGLYQREITDETGLPLQPVQRELANLVELGIIKKQETHNRVFYQISAASALFKPLSEIFEIFSEKKLPQSKL